MSELKRLALTPLLVGVHAGWTIADSVKRIRLRVPSSCGRLSSSGKTPRHVAVALVLPPSIDFHVDGRCGSPSLGKGKGRAVHDELEDEVEKEVLGCVDELVRWAAELGASELSLWNEHGLIGNYQDSILKHFNLHPPSPPSSGTASPPFRVVALHSDGEDPGGKWDGGESALLNKARPQAELLSVSVWPELEHVLDQPSPSAHILRRPLTVHLLSTTASSQLFTSIADDLAVRDDLDVEDIDQELVQRMIDDRLRFETDPDLLIIHHLQPRQSLRQLNAHSSLDHAIDQHILPLPSRLPSRPSLFKMTLKALLPAQPPELHGYPFWSLRITEIYQHPSEPICLSSLLPGLGISRILPRTLFVLGGDDSVRSDVARRSWERGTWNDAVRRWQGVEQRLGR